MNINFENINKIGQIVTILNNMKNDGGVEKKWLNTNEAAEYTGYTVESINKFVKSGELYQNKHFFKKDKKAKRIFDKSALDEWIESFAYEDIDDIVNEIISSVEV